MSVEMKKKIPLFDSGELREDRKQTASIIVYDRSANLTESQPFQKNPRHYVVNSIGNSL